MPKRKNYVQFPTRAFYCALTPVQFRILGQLCQLAFRFRSKADPQRPFFFTDRDLADRCSCSTHSVSTAKKKLAQHNLIQYTTDKKNTTHYRILYQDPLGAHLT